MRSVQSERWHHHCKRRLFHPVQVTQFFVGPRILLLLLPDHEGKVALYVAGTVFHQEVQARDCEDAKKTALEGNPTETMVSVTAVLAKRDPLPIEQNLRSHRVSG